MGRGIDQATGAATAAQGLSNTYAGNASNIFGALAPQLMSQAANPQGMGPTEMANADTAAQQSAGGSMGAAVGQGALRSARLRNAGAGDAAIGQSARTAGEQLSTAGLTTRLRDASMKHQQRTEALGGLSTLFGQNATAGNQALGQIAPLVNANTGAEDASWNWSKYLMQPLLGAAGKMRWPSGGNNGGGRNNGGGGGNNGGGGGGYGGGGGGYPGGGWSPGGDWNDWPDEDWNLWE